MNALQIGARTDGRPFSLPLELVTQTEAVLGIRGSGKTNTASVQVEEALKAGVQVVVIDPTDGWWGLKSSADGQSAGHPVVILGGPHSDLELHADAGSAIADFAVEHRVPLVLSLRHLRKGDQRRFVTDFAEQLYHRKGETQHRVPLLVVIDEASQFIPQKVMGETARLVGAIQDLVRLGRSSGFGVVLIDQRPASVNKDVLTQLEVLVAHQITSPQDRKALTEWIEQHDTGDHRKAFLDSLASLPRGVAWIWSPSLDVFERVQVRARETFDSSRTPKLGEVLAPPEAWAKVDLEALSQQLAASLAEAEINSPRALKKRIADLDAQLRVARSAEPDPEEVTRAVELATAPLHNRVSQFEGKVSIAAGLAEQLVATLRNGATAPSPLVIAAVPSPSPAPAPTRSAERSRLPAAANAEAPTAGPSGPQQKILDVLGRLAAIGLVSPEREVVAALSGYTASGGTFKNYLGSLRSAKLIWYPESNQVKLTEEGLNLVPDAAEAPAALADLHAGWMSVLEGPHRRVLQVVIDVYPMAISREELAERTDYEVTGGTFKNYLGRLRTMGAIWYPSTGEVMGTKLLFPEGLR